MTCATSLCVVSTFEKMARITLCSFFILTASLVHGANNQNSEWLPEASEEDLGAIRNLSNGLTGKFPVPSFHGTIHLIPSKSWAIAGYDLIVDLPKVGEQSASSLALKGHIDYQMMVDLGGNDTPVPKTMSLTAGTNESNDELTITLTEWEFIELPTNEFTLSAFGLPEVAVVDVRSNKVVVFLFLTAFLCLVIGVLFRRKQTVSDKVTKNLA